VSEIRGVARLVSNEGKVKEFKRVCAELIYIRRARDSGTLQFEIYLSSAVTRNHVGDGAACDDR
jgi:quinol monooxygenase YgiN